MIGFVNWKLIRRTLIPFQESYVELAACLAVFFFALVCSAIKTRRQFWRHVVQGVSLLMFFFVVSSCLGVFGLIRNAFHGASLIGKDDLNAFYFLSITVVIISASFHSGAVFCGWICPTGSLQELVSGVRRAFRKEKRYVVAPTGIALGGLAAAAVVFLWVVYLVFSGRRPFPEDSAVLWAISLVVIIFLTILFPKRERALKSFRPISLGLIVFSILLGMSVYSPVHFVFSNVHDRASLLSTLVIMLSGIWVARAWCRYLCPFGYVCSQLNRVALRRLFVSQDCSECGRCGEVCEVGAIEKGRIDYAACTMCLACADACPSQCIRYVNLGVLASWRETRRAGGTSRRGAKAQRGAAKFFCILLWVAFSLTYPLKGTSAPSRTELVEEWPSFRGSPLNDASVSLRIDAEEKPEEWTFKPSSWTWAYRPGTGIWSSPSIGKIGERIVLFVGSYDKNLYAIDAFTGKELWRYTTGGEIFSTPALARVNGQSLLFFGSAERILYALDATPRRGSKVWAYQLVDWRYTVGESYVSSPAVFSLGGRKVVLFCWWAHDASFAQPLETTEAVLLDCADGHRIWQNPFSKSQPSSPCVATIDAHPRIYVSARDGNTYCLAGETGQLLWKHTSRGEIVSSPACASHLNPPLVFVGSRYGNLHALDARDGSPVWVFKAGHWIDSSPAVVKMAGESFVIFGSHDQTVYCLNACTGRVRWTFFTKGDVYSSPALFDADNRTLLAIASGDDYLYILDAWSGRELQRYRPGRFLWGYRVVGDSVWSSPIAAFLNGQWMVFAPFYDGEVHAYNLSHPAEAELGGARSRSSYGEIMLLKIALTALGTLLLAGILFRFGPRETSTPQ